MLKPILKNNFSGWAVTLLLTMGLMASSFAQTLQSAKVALGSQTAKGGFQNETEIAGKFNNWREDADARGWIAAMNYKLGEIESVTATKPHGEKADVEVRIRLKPTRNFPQSRKDAEKSDEKVEGISIKLVSSPNGFNQIDKRRLATYAKMWKMPAGVVASLKLFVGETPPAAGSRDKKRMYLNELDAGAQAAVVEFFTVNRDEIVSDLFQGDGDHAAGWMMVALKATEKTRWTLRTSTDVVRFFGEGKVETTRGGNLKIGRVTMQRKGGDGGRETAKMLQFKINPVQLFDAK